MPLRASPVCLAGGLGEVAVGHETHQRAFLLTLR